LSNYPTNNPDNPTAPERRRIFLASVAALGVALVLLFTVVLPVEYEYDPLGTGRLLGLDALANVGTNPLEAQPEAYREDVVEFYLEPFQSVEYKYLMDLDAPLIFSWSADGELYYDMHAEPAALGPEFAESYEQGSATARAGSYHAPFTGIHGWFWENRGRQDVVVTLHTAGFYVNATVFGDMGELQRELSPVTAP
jgi:hypothetical protein